MLYDTILPSEGAESHTPTFRIIFSLLNLLFVLKIYITDWGLGIDPILSGSSHSVELVSFVLVLVLYKSKSNKRVIHCF